MEANPVIIGMDFGTTNSGMAHYDGARLRLIPFGSSESEWAINRTALYLTNDQSVYIGRAAIDQYMAHNIGRPSKIERSLIGYVDLVLPDMPIIHEEVYAERDVLAPGRLFISFKTMLSSAAYRGTVVGGFFYGLEDIVAVYLHVAKLRAERFLGQEVTGVVLGRPVHFSLNPSDDKLAQARLIEAAFRAGYQEVYLEYEPVAAALQYATTAEGPQRVLIFDFGGGTLDVTVVELGGGRRAVLGTGGIPIAGDVFDQRIVRAKMAQRFGEGGSYGPPTRKRAVPAWIYDSLSSWQTLFALQAPKQLALLREIAAGADKREPLEALAQLVANNYGLTMFDAVERAKRALSDAPEAAIEFSGPGLSTHVPIARREFELLIGQELRAVDGLLDEVLRDAGMRADQIDAVVRTGGSAQIPVVIELLARRFGAEKVRAIDAFSSVTAGLGVLAQRVAAGAADVPPVHRPAPGPRDSGNPAAIDPAFLRRWIGAQERARAASDEAASAGSSRRLLVGLGAESRFAIAPEEAPFPEPGEAMRLRPNQALLAAPDSRILVATSSYRLVLTTARRLQVLAETGIRLAELERFEPAERITAIGAWPDDAQLLAIVAAGGAIRLLDRAKVADSLDRALPFRLEQPPAGPPVALLGVRTNQEAALITAAGRAARVRLSYAALPGFQGIKCDKGDAVVAALPVRPNDTLLLLSGDGAYARVAAESIPLALTGGTRGKAVAGRMSVQVALADDGAEHTLLTTCGLRRANLAALTPAGGKRKAATIAPLEAGETIVAAL
jgi:hypothetical chaperone protein